MKNKLSMVVHTHEVEKTIEDTNNIYLSVLKEFNLPTEDILSSIDERRAVISNFPHVIGKLNHELRDESQYLSKFFVAVAIGLFDAALNYLWDETIKQLRIRVVCGDLKYFYDVVLGDEKRKQFNTPKDLLKLDDIELVKGALAIGLITPIGYKHLDFIRYMRNWASAAHPNQAEITGLNLISWMEICIKEIISTPPSSIQVKIGQLLSNIKTEIISDEQARTMIELFSELTTEKADALIKGFFGIYIDEAINQQTRTNINNLAPSLWEIVSEEVKYDFGIRYATFLANGDNQTKNNAMRFLEVVGGISYLPESVKIPVIKMALDNLMVAHNGFNNFYNEPSFAKQLYNIVGEHKEIPRQIYFQYVKIIVSVFLTNGKGVAWDANPIYIELIKSFNAKQSFIAITSFCDEQIKSKLQFLLCQEKFNEVIECVEPNITSEGVLELLQEIKKNISELCTLSENDKLIKKIQFFQKSYLG